MHCNTQILLMDPSSKQLEELADEAGYQGYRFVDRLRQEAASGQNKFDQRGECFCGVFVDGQLVGCGGVNVDPYLDQRVGRLRHVYVLERFRRAGMASALVHELLERSRSSFSLVRIRTSDAKADKFYEALDFRRIEDESATHSIEI